MRLFGKLIKANKITILIIQVLFVITLFSGCNNTKADFVELPENKSGNDKGNTVVTEEKQNNDTKQNRKKVIALSKSNAELWILAGGELVATSEDALKIKDLNDNVENLGDMDHVSLEAITALDPDLLILFSTEPAQKALGEAAEEIGIPVAYTNIDGFSDYEKIMKDFTKITGRDDLYEKNVVWVREKIDGIVSKVPEGEKKTYLLLHVSATKSKAEKNDYFACEIFNRLGLENIASDDSSFNELSMEAVVSADPDYIFVVPRGDETKAIAGFEGVFASDPAWESLSAVKTGNYKLLSKDLFGLKPNDRWGEAYEEAYKILYVEE